MAKKNYYLIFLMLSLFITNVSAGNIAPVEQLKAKLTQHQGKVIYVDFWASWCGPCRESFPWLNNIQARYQDEGFLVISVNVDAQKHYATEFLAQFPADFDVIYDPKGNIIRQYQVRGMPSSFIVDRTGKIVASHTGFNEHKKVKYEKEIIALLKGKHE